MVADVRVSSDRENILSRYGFLIEPRNNYQGRNGWLTGLFIPYDTNHYDVVRVITLEALLK